MNRWECMYRDCPSVPVALVTAPGGHRPWPACPEHLPGMKEALSLGFGSSDEAEVIPLAASEAV